MRCSVDFYYSPDIIRMIKSMGLDGLGMQYAWDDDDDKCIQNFGQKA
jgi:hypothetical protein